MVVLVVVMGMLSGALDAGGPAAASADGGWADGGAKAEKPLNRFQDLSPAEPSDAGTIDPDVEEKGPNSKLQSTSIVVSGGVSLGSYQAGLLHLYTQYLLAHKNQVAKV